MATSVAFLGNAIAALQVADVIGFTRLESWPHLPIFLRRRPATARRARP